MWPMTNEALLSIQSCEQFTLHVMFKPPDLTFLVSFHSGLFNYIFKCPVINVIWRIQMIWVKFNICYMHFHMCTLLHLLHHIDIHTCIKYHSLMGKYIYQRPKFNKQTHTHARMYACTHTNTHTVRQLKSTRSGQWSGRSALWWLSWALQQMAVPDLCWVTAKGISPRTKSPQGEWITRWMSKWLL